MHLVRKKFQPSWEHPRIPKEPQRYQKCETRSHGDLLRAPAAQLLVLCIDDLLHFVLYCTVFFIGVFT